jgi:hypothetical protein
LAGMAQKVCDARHRVLQHHRGFVWTSTNEAECRTDDEHATQTV